MVAKVALRANRKFLTNGREGSSQSPVISRMRSIEAACTACIHTAGDDPMSVEMASLIAAVATDAAERINFANSCSDRVSGSQDFPVCDAVCAYRRRW
jgi:hypothetical protein